MKTPFRKPMRLSARLTITYVIVFSAMLILLSIGVVLGTRAYLRADAKNDVQGVSTVIHDRLLDEHLENEPLDDPEVTQGYDANPFLNILILDPGGARIAAHFNFDVPTDLLQQVRETPTQLAGHNIEYTAQKSALVLENQPVADIIVFRSFERERNFLATMKRMLLLFDAFGVLLAIVTGYVMSRRMLAPIANMTDTAGRIGMRALGERLEVPTTNDELSSLATTFNAMLDRLESAFEQQNRFVSDASHELRTPIMVVQGYAKMLDRWGKQDEAVLQESIDAIAQETENMGALIEKLLFLARGDAGRQALQKREFFPCSLLDELRREYELLYPSREFSVACQEDAALFADPTLIKQMMRALLDNAVKYTSDGGRIEMLGDLQNDGFLLRVKDDGCGIPQRDITRVFDRFYRVDEARGKSTGGHGLGLSIVAWIVKSHDGSIHLESQGGKGTIVDIYLPFTSGEHAKPATYEG